MKAHVDKDTCIGCGLLPMISNHKVIENHWLNAIMRPIFAFH